jgi:hypothetical protein
MDIASLIIGIVVIGLVCWLVQAYILPLLPDPFRTIVIVLGALLLILWLLQFLPGNHSFRLLH